MTKLTRDAVRPLRGGLATTKEARAERISRRAVLRMLGIVASGAIMPGLVAGCGGGDGRGESRELQALLVDRWQQRYAGMSGGLTLVMIGPRGEHFATTLDGVTPDWSFRGASTTKTFTAAAIMLLDQRGLVNIDDVVTANIPGRAVPYLPATKDYDIVWKDRITIRDLLQHRAGVFDLVNTDVPTSVHAPYAGQRYVNWRMGQAPDFEYHSFTKDELIAVLASNRLSHAEPGIAFHYSDMHFSLLGRIVEEVSGLPLAVFNDRELLQPNGLVRTHFVTDGREVTLPQPGLPGHVLVDGAAWKVPDYNYSYDQGSGNVYTTVADLSRWIRRLARGESGISARQVARMREPGRNEYYGLGLELNRSIPALGWGHNGTAMGYNTDAYHDPATDVSYVLECTLIDPGDFPGADRWCAETALAARELLGY